eukprot:CAMPEP_0206506300 /NCGR_PEP_ID=MMETSP0324_2-20121206/56681_1 /ASSEMBLY_ACC=CAM_ASM_000836 /TAXON_ID=2866 /ORGANISM="Crypthecodinium cohnii, Strain Seligo" /LENGTH=561 /DNA_ID=CAMNT_0053995999 /DNA_START=30 /DNA_END=1712 /DNA_ORIENTATION=-
MTGMAKGWQQFCFIGMGVMISINMLLWIRQLCKGKCKGIRTGWSSWIIHQAEKALANLRFEEADPDLALLVQQRLLEIWVQRGRRLAKILNYLCTVLWAPEFLLYLVQGEATSVENGLEASGLSTLFVSAVAAHLPGFVQAKTLPVWYSIGMAHIIWAMHLLSATGSFWATSPALFLGRLLLIWSCSSLGLVVIWNLLYTLLVMTRAYNYEEQTPAYVYKEYFFKYVMWFATVGSVELAMTIALIIICQHWRLSLQRTLRFEAQSSAFDRETAATSVLLHSTCDVVVELDGNLVVAEDCPRFGAFLMLGPNHSTKGLLLQQYMPSRRDVLVFEEKLKLADVPDHAASAGAWHLKMRDSIGNTIDMEIFHASFRGVDGSVRHLIGMREFTDSQIAPLVSQTGENRPWSKATRSRQERYQHVRDAAREGAFAQSRGGLDGGSGAGSPSRDLPWDHLSDTASWLQGSQSSLDAESETPTEDMVIPHLKATTSEARRISLLHALLTWNVPLPERSCCPLHVAVAAGEKVLNAMSFHPCLHNVYDEASASLDQCLDCGILGDADEW